MHQKPITTNVRIADCHNLQLLMFDKRMKFHSPDGRQNDKITFSSSYYCWDFLPKQIIMEQLNVTTSQTTNTLLNFI